MSDDLCFRANKKRKQTDKKSKVIDYSDPLAVPNLLETISSSKFGSMTKEVEALLARNMQVFHSFNSLSPNNLHNEGTVTTKNIIPSVPMAPVVILDSDEDEDPLQPIDLDKQAEELLLQGSALSSNGLHNEGTVTTKNIIPSVPMAPVVVLDSDEDEDPLQPIDLDKQAEELLLQRSANYEACKLPGTSVCKEKEKKEEIKGRYKRRDK